VSDTDWAAIAADLDQRRAIYTRTGLDYQAADAKALEDRFHQWADAQARLAAEVKWQYHWADKCQQAERDLRRAQQLVDVTQVARVDAVLEAVHSVPCSRTAKHAADCWQRHPGCLARRVSNLINGKEV